MALGGAAARRATRSPASSPRAPNEQIYNNATEGTKVALRRLARRASSRAGRATRTSPCATSRSWAAMPGMALPRARHCEAEVARVRRRGPCTRPRGPVYIRARERAVGARLRAAGRRRRSSRGAGTVVREGDDARVSSCTGPVLLSQAVAAAERLAAEVGGVVALPWLRDVDGAWLAEVAGDARDRRARQPLARGGQGDAVRAALRRPARGACAAVERVPGLRHERRGAARARAGRGFARSATGRRMSWRRGRRRAAAAPRARGAEL